MAPVVIAALNNKVGPGTFMFGSLPNQGIDIERIEEMIQSEIKLLQTEGVTEREMEKAINNLRANRVRSRLTVQGKASALQNAVLHFGDPFYINTDLARYEAVTVDDVLRVARKYLTADNRTVVIAP